MVDPTAFWLALVAGAATAGFVQGLSGFAFSMVAMSFWTWTLDPRLAAVLAVHGSLCGQLIAVTRMRRSMHWRAVGPYLAGGLAGLPVGLFVLRGIDPMPFRLMLGALLVVWCPLMLLSPRLPALRAGGRVADAAVGAAGGVLSALGGLSGVLPTMWCTLRRMDKDLQRQVIQNFNLAMLASTMAAYVLSGAITRPMLVPVAVETASLAVPVLLGMRLFAGLGTEAFRRVVLALLGVSGATMLANVLARLAPR